MHLLPRWPKGHAALWSMAEGPAPGAVPADGRSGRGRRHTRGLLGTCTVSCPSPSLLIRLKWGKMPLTPAGSDPGTPSRAASEAGFAVGAQEAEPARPPASSSRIQGGALRVTNCTARGQLPAGSATVAGRALQRNGTHRECTVHTEIAEALARAFRGPTLPGPFGVRWHVRPSESQAPYESEAGPGGNPVFLGEAGLSGLCRPSTDWVRPTHSRRAAPFIRATDLDATFIQNHSHRHTQNDV